MFLNGIQCFHRTCLFFDELRADILVARVSAEDADTKNDFADGPTGAYGSSTNVLIERREFVFIFLRLLFGLYIIACMIHGHQPLQAHEEKDRNKSEWQK